MKKWGEFTNIHFEKSHSVASEFFLDIQNVSLVTVNVCIFTYSTDCHLTVGCVTPVLICQMTKIKVTLTYVKNWHCCLADRTQLNVKNFKCRKRS